MRVTVALYQSGAATLLIVGVVLWVRALVKGHAQKWLETPPRLPAWSIGWGDFLMLPFVVLLLLMFAPTGLAWLFGIELTQPPGDAAVMVSGFGMGIAFVGGTLLFRLHPAGHPTEGHESPLRCIAAGLLALVYFMPACTAVALAWDWVLDLVNVPHDVQYVVMMIRDTESAGMLVLWLLLVVVVAPLGEELVFRAGIFRFLANRMRPGFAAAISATVFALLHWNLQSSVPLFLLGLVLASVYHKSGRLLTSIVVHATFNLNTLLGIMSGAIR